MAIEKDQDQMNAIMVVVLLLIVFGLGIIIGVMRCNMRMGSTGLIM